MKYRYHILLVVFALLSVGLFLPGTAQQESDMDYASFLDKYDETTHQFIGIEVEDEVLITDEVLLSYVFEKDTFIVTRVYLESTGASVNSPNLTFPGDLTSKYQKGVNFSINLTVEEIRVGNDTVFEIHHRIVADEQKAIINEEENSGNDTEKEEFTIFRITKEIEDLPPGLQSSWARFGVAVGAWAAVILVVWLLYRLLILATKKTETSVDNKVIKIIRIPFFTLMVLAGIIESISQFDLPERWVDILGTFSWAITIVLIAMVAVNVFRNVVMVYLKINSRKTETEADDVLVPIFGNFVTAAIWIIAGIYLLNIFGLDATALLGAMGIVGLVIAFAAQDTLSNFFSGIMILLDRPFKEEDWIILDGSVYQVKHVGLRSTRLFSSWTQQLVTLPNAKISGMMFSNMTEPDMLGRRTLKFSVGYDSDIEKVREVVERITKAHPGILYDDDHSIIVRFNDFGASALDWAVTFFVKDYNDQWAIASDLRKELVRQFRIEGIDIPFPQRVIHMDGERPGTVTMKGYSMKGDDPEGMKNLSP